MDKKTQFLLQGHSIFENLPADIIELADIFVQHSCELSLVGGPVRDAFLGREIHDFDLTTNAHPQQTQELLSLWTNNTWDVGKDFGTIAGMRNDITVEITTYRSEEYDATSRKPTVTYGTSLEGDMTRRDFTVNAMAVRLPSIELVDPCGGLDDLVAGILRTPAQAVQSFDDDPLRIMRAGRFAAQLSFDIEEDVRQAMKDMASRLRIVSAERIRDELVKLLMSDNPRRGIDALMQTGVIDEVLPELRELLSTEDAHKRHKDVYTHSLMVLEQVMALESGERDVQAGEYSRDVMANRRLESLAALPDDMLGGSLPGPDVPLRLAALLHDIGKPATRRFESDGSVTFRGHDIVGARMARKRLRALHFDKQTIKTVTRLIELHLRAFGFAEAGLTDSAVRRFVRDAGEELPRLLRLIRADVTSQNAKRISSLHQGNDELARRITELKKQEELDAIRPDLSGEQIMEILHLKPGRLVGQARQYMLDVRLEEGPLPYDEAVKRLMGWWNNRENKVC